MPNTIIYAEFLTIPYLFRDVLPALKKPSSTGHLYVFDSTTTALFLSRILGLVFGFKVEKLSFQMSDVRDDEGTCIYLKVRYKGLQALQELIFQEFPPPEKLETYLAKAPFCSYDLYGYAKHSELWHALVLVGIVNWHRKKLKAKEDTADLHLFERPFEKVLADDAHGSNIRVHNIGPFRLHRLFFKEMWSFCNKIKPSLFFYLLRHPRRVFPGKVPVITATKSSPTAARMMVEYWGQFNLDRPGCVSDIFFLDPSGIEGSDVCLVFNNRMDPVNQVKLDQMSERGITAVSRTIQSSLVDEKKAPVFRYQQEFQSAQDFPGPWKGFISEYHHAREYWKKFFDTYNIKLWTTWFKYDASHMAMADAINDTGGISSVYQRSYESNPSPFFTVASDLIFGFSPRGYELHRQSRSRFKYHIAVGFIGDHRFEHLRSQALEIRNKLLSQGAERIIAYFDEISIDDGRWLMGHQMFRENYEFWLNKIFEDDQLGIIFKPKVPGTLHQRLGPVAELLVKAQKTGRCYVFEEGIFQGAFPPASAALAADISIQESLWGGTAGIEAALAGSKTLLLDTVGLPSSPLYQLGPQVVFKDQTGLWNACQEHWKIPGGNPALGNWSSMINEIDPFHDGKAAHRMSGYLKELLEGLRHGQKPMDVMEETAENYTRRWGKDKVQRGLR